MTYIYGMRARPFSIGTAPTKGILERMDDKDGLYWDLLKYSRKLTGAELKEYELDFLEVRD